MDMELPTSERMRHRSASAIFRGHFKPWSRKTSGIESLLALEGLILEQLIHVGSEHPQIEIVVYTPTINRILEKAVDLWPLWLFALALLQNVG